jgi:hypothetical protein
MVIDDFDVVCIAIQPSEAHAPLVIYTDTVLASSVAFQHRAVQRSQL